MSLLAAILALAVAGAPAPGAASARASTELSAEELLARNRAASGGEHRPEAERESWAIRLSGLDGTLETLRRGSDVLSSTALGPFRYERGVDRGQHWHQNDNGETVLDRAEPSQGERVAGQSVLRVHEPVDAWELVTSYGNGHVLRSYYDARTFLLVRVERTAAGHTLHTVYDDFRTDARGRTRPWHYSGSDDRPDTTFDYRLLRDDLTPALVEGEFAVPRDRRTVVEFPNGIDTVRLPARIERGRVYVRLTIAGRGLDFLLDTGAAAITIDDGVARALHLAVYGRSTQTVAGSFETSRAIAPLVSVGPLAMHDVVMRTIPIAAREGADTRIVGLLGFDFLDAVALKIDYANGTLEASRPGTMGVPAGTVPLEVRLNSQTPVARATVGDASGDDFILDTGAEFAYVLFQRFAHAHPDAVTAQPAAAVQLGSGVGGAMAYRAVETRRLTLGPFVFEDTGGVEALSPTALGFDTEDGLIGSDLLRRFTVYLDYAAARVYLAPPARAARGDSSARSFTPVLR